jgi:hypothetical protein
MTGGVSGGARNAVNDGAWHSFGGGTASGRNSFSAFGNSRPTSSLRAGTFGSGAFGGNFNRGFGGFGNRGFSYGGRFGYGGFRGGCWGCGFGWGLGFGWGYPYWNAGFWGYPYPYYGLGWGPYWGNPWTTDDYPAFYDYGDGPYGDSDSNDPNATPNNIVPNNSVTPNAPNAAPQNYDPPAGYEGGAALAPPV